MEAVLRRVLRLLGIVFLPMAWSTAAHAQSKAIAVTNVTVIDGTKANPRVVTVIVEGDRIAAVTRAGRERLPVGATIVDGRGKYLIPEIWDMHVHLGGHDEGAKLLPRLVAYGITGVRDMASPVDDILRLRREIADGTLLGPQIVAAGPTLQRPLPFSTPPLVRTVTNDVAKQVVEELHAKGVDFIKVGDTLARDAYFGIGGAPAFQRFLERELVPEIEERYRANSSRRILFGQSRGGYMVLYSAFTNPELFWGRIASNPSFDPGRERFFSSAAPASRNDLGLVVTSGSRDRPALRQAALEWFAAWQTSRPKPWALHTVTIEGGTHAADSTSSYRAGMVWLFNRAK